MNNQKLAARISLVMSALIWGITFVMVKDALNDVGPFYFAALRFAIACIITILVINRSIINLTPVEIIGGLICGFFLFAAYAFQNFGLIITTASKSAFITSISVLLVPVILQLFSMQAIKKSVWLAVIIASFGLFLLLNPGGGGINWGDILTFGCALGFAIHIIVQDIFVKKGVDILRFFLVQACAVCVLSAINGFIFEPEAIIWSNRLWSALLVTGILASFVAIIFMIWAQKILNPSETAIIFSLEPVFAALFAAAFAGEILGPWGWIGGGFVVIAVALSESG